MIRRFCMAFKVVPSRRDIEQFIERFVERKLKESRIEERIAELRRVLGLEKKRVKPPHVQEKAEEKYEAVPSPHREEKKSPVAPVAARKAVPAKSAKPVKKAAPKKAAAAPDEPLSAVLAALDVHPEKAGLITAGQQKNQLLRSLIPLYVAQKLDVEVTSGVASKFWASHGVTFAAPNAAKVLREHAGYAKRTAKGLRITASGLKYVEDALAAS
jgi:hypothetical protein